MAKIPLIFLIRIGGGVVKYNYMKCENCGFKHQCGVGWALSNGAAGVCNKSNDPWDNLKVGSKLLTDNKIEVEVLHIVGDIFTFKLSTGNFLQWMLFEDAKKDGWTIKDSTPKNNSYTNKVSGESGGKSTYDSTPKEDVSDFATGKLKNGDTLIISNEKISKYFTPKEEKKDDFYHYDLSEADIISCPDNEPGCLVLHYKPRTNQTYPFMNKITQTIMDSLEKSEVEFFKMIYEDTTDSFTIRDFIKSHLLQSQIKVIEAVIESFKEGLPNMEECDCMYCYALRKKSSSLNQVLSELMNSCDVDRPMTEGEKEIAGLLDDEL